MRERPRRSGHLNRLKLGLICSVFIVSLFSGYCVPDAASLTIDEFPNGLFLMYEWNYKYYGSSLVDDTYPILYNFTGMVASNRFIVVETIQRRINPFHPYPETEYIVEYPDCDIAMFSDAPLWIDPTLLKASGNVTLGSWIYEVAPNGDTQYSLELIDNTDEGTLIYDTLGILRFRHLIHFDSDGIMCYEKTTTLENSNHASLVPDRHDLNTSRWALTGLLVIGIAVEVVIIYWLVKRRKV